MDDRSRLLELQADHISRLEAENATTRQRAMEALIALRELYQASTASEIKAARDHAARVLGND